MNSYHMCMVRVTYHLTEKQFATLKKLAKQTGLAVAEIIRRSVDAYLETNHKGEKRGSEGKV